MYRGENKYCKDFDYIVASIEEDIIVKFYSRIGQYDFTKKDKIEPLKKSWTLINDVDGKGEYYFDSREVIKKNQRTCRGRKSVGGKSQWNGIKLRIIRLGQMSMCWCLKLFAM